MRNNEPGLNIEIHEGGAAGDVVIGVENNVLNIPGELENEVKNPSIGEIICRVLKITTCTFLGGAILLSMTYLGESLLVQCIGIFAFSCITVCAVRISMGEEVWESVSDTMNRLLHVDELQQQQEIEIV